MRALGRLPIGWVSGWRIRSIGDHVIRDQVIRTGCERMGFKPQRPGHFSRIEPGGFPPRRFIAGTMDLAMMASAQRHREFVADLAAKRGMLGEAKMVRVRWFAAAHQAGLLGDKSKCCLVPNPARLRQCERTLVDAAGSQSFMRVSVAAAKGRQF